jgi:hypothetical protein
VIWTPSVSGRYLFTATAFGADTTSRATVPLHVEDPE